MTPCALIRRTAELFRSAGIPDPETDSALLLSFLCNRPSLALRLDTDTVLSDEMLEKYYFLSERRITREPLQYITNEAPFCGRVFYVDSRVLIPRPETELLCHWALELPLSEGMSVLDLCCGSGCIGLTIAAEKPGISVLLSDISSDAMDVASINAERLGLRVRTNCGDLTSGLPDRCFDLIISNPPYIPSGECAFLQPEVKQEPYAALDGGMDGLDFYRRIIKESTRTLKQNGMLMMEIGLMESEPVCSFLRQYGYASIEIRKDFSGIDRMILSRLHSEDA